MPRILGRLWRSGARRAPVADAAPAGADQAPADPRELSRRLEEARQRLRQSIPPPEEDRPGDDAAPK